MSVILSSSNLNFLEDEDKTSHSLKNLLRTEDSTNLKAPLQTRTCQVLLIHTEHMTATLLVLLTYFPFLFGEGSYFVSSYAVPSLYFLESAEITYSSLVMGFNSLFDFRLLTVNMLFKTTNPVSS